MVAGKTNWLSQQREIESLTASGRLMATDMAMTIALYPSDLKYEAERTLLGRVGICKGDEFRRSWRKALAEMLLTYNFQTWEWLSEHVYPLPPPKKSQISKDPEGRSRDIRLKTDTELQRTGEFLEDLDTDMLNLNEGDEEVMDVDIYQAALNLISQSPMEGDRCTTLPTEPVSPAKPISPVKPIRRQDTESADLDRSRLKPRSEPGSSSHGRTREAIGNDRPGSQPTEESRSSRRDRSKETSSNNDTRLKSRSEHGSTRQIRQDQRRKSPPSSRRGNRGRYQHSRERPRYEDSREYQPRDYHPGVREQPHRDSEHRRRDHSETQESRGKKLKTSHLCPVTDYCQKHAFETHLPLLFHPYITGKEVAAGRRTALVTLQRMLVGTHKTIQDLVGMAKSVESHRDRDEPSPKLHQGMREFMEEVSKPVPCEFDMNTAGIWTLLHWKRLLCFISLLKPGDQIHFKDLFKPSPEEKKQLPHIPSAFDSHCHLDRCMNKLGIISHSLASINSTVTVREKYQVDVQHAVGVFCDPETYPTRDQVREWKSQGVVVAVGLHPRKTNPSAEQWQKFEELLSWPEITALEVGIGRTEPVNTWSSQMLNLDRALQSLRPDPDEAWLTCLFILNACPRVTREHLIHCHCFMGPKKLVQRWTCEFPNTYFGFTSIVSRFRNHKDTTSLDCIKWLYEHRLLLETDAPYFPKGGHRRSVPALLGYSADEVAKIRGVAWQDLLKKANCNATHLYLDGAAPATETT